MKFRGILSFVHCNRSKCARFGMKVYRVCDSSTGYCHYFKIYTGNDKVDSNLLAGTNVMDKCEPLCDKGHTLCLDK
jgi:hypothetical protein